MNRADMIIERCTQLVGSEDPGLRRRAAWGLLVLVWGVMREGDRIVFLNALDGRHGHKYVKPERRS